MTALLGQDGDNRSNLFLGAFATAAAALTASHLYLRSSRTRQQRTEGEKRRKEAQEAKTELRHTLNGERNDLVGLPFQELRRKLRDGEIVPLDLLRAFQYAALEADVRLNAVTEPIREVETFCAKLETVPTAERGPLFGIPLSVKENLAIEGYDLCLGCPSHCFRIQQETHFLVEALIRAGMVPFVRTNLSQIARSRRCENPVFGETLNPLDLDRTAGSSSGGEAALVAAGGSLIGLGTDVGGSVRIPAFYCGVFGFRPTSGRVLGKRTTPVELDMNPLLFNDSIGPLSSDLDLLVEVMRVFFGPLHFDLNPHAVPLPFDEETLYSEQPLRIGFYTSFTNNLFVQEPIPAIQRQILEVKAALEAKGHILVPWDPPQIGKACRLIMQAVFMDGGEKMRRFQQQEMVMTKALRMVCSLPTKSYLPKLILSGLYRFINPELAECLSRIKGARSVTEVCDLAEAIQTYKEDFAASWGSAQLDVLICPVWENVAPRSFEAQSFERFGIYSKVFNLIDYPSGTVPVGAVTEQDVKDLLETYPRRTETDMRLIESAKDTVGLPLGVQCVAMKFRDEMALRVMREVRNAVSEDRVV